MAHPPLPMPATRGGFDPRVPFTRADARAAGISDRQLAGPAYLHIVHDVYVAAGVDVGHLLRASIALRFSDEEAHVSHFTAAQLWQAWVPDDADVHVSVGRGRRRSKRRGIATHVANPAAEVVLHRGLRMSSPAQTILNLSGPLGLVDLVVLGDSLVRRGHTSPAQLIAASDAWRGHGAKVARRAARLVRDGVDSPMETRLRLLIVLAGLPEPVVNHTFTDEDGRWTMRLDLSYPQWQLAIEYDGRHHAETDQQWQHDLDRREVLDRIAWRLIVVRAPGIYVDPAGTLDRIVQALRDCGAGTISPRGDEWRRHFPGRAAAA